MSESSNTFDHPIACAYCGSENLHHYSVEVFKRYKEDSPVGTYTEVGELMTCTADNHPMDNNPSGRRDGIRILCECECCVELTEIRILQHKGCTYLEVVKNDESVIVELHDLVEPHNPEDEDEDDEE